MTTFLSRPCTLLQQLHSQKPLATCKAEQSWQMAGVYILGAGIQLGLMVMVNMLKQLV